MIPSTLARLAPLALVASFGFACGDSSSPSDFDEASVQVLESADFCAFETYDFEEFRQVPGGTADVDLEDIAEAQIRLQNAIANEFAESDVERDSPGEDLEVNIYFQYNEELIAEESCEAVIIAPGQVIYTCDWVTVEEYDFGTAVIDLVDREDRQLVLRGVITGAATGNDSEERINRLVARVFDAYEEQLDEDGCTPVQPPAEG